MTGNLLTPIYLLYTFYALYFTHINFTQLSRCSPPNSSSTQSHTLHTTIFTEGTLWCIPTL